MRLRGATPLTITQREASTFFAFAAADNRVLVGSLAPHIASAKCIFDIGGNSGFFSRELIEMYPDYRGTIVLFEPIAHLMSLSVRVLAPYTHVTKIFTNAALGE